MGYGFSEVEAALALIHNIASDKRSAFVGRLKYLQKQAILPNANTGRGKAADYQAEDAMLLGLALQLCEFGLSPDKAAKMIRRSMGYIAEGVLRATLPTPYETTSPVMCFAPASNLEDLKAHQDTDFGIDFMRLGAWIDEAQATLGREPGALGRTSFFSFSSYLIFLPRMLRLRNNEHERQFWGDLRKWAWPIVAIDRRHLFARAPEERDHG